MRELSAMKVEMGNGTTNDPDISVSQPTNKLVYRYGVNRNSHIILAVNIANLSSVNGQALYDVQFALPEGVLPSQVEVLGENRTIPVTNGIFTDNFNRFAVHSYRFITGASTPPETSKVLIIK